MPEWLDERAQLEWRRIVDILDEAGVLASSDMGLLADYCSAHSLAVRATIAYQEDGLMQEKKFEKMMKDPKVGNSAHLSVGKLHPMIKVAQEARQQAMRLGIEFGLSPAARSRISVDDSQRMSKPKNDKDADFMFSPPKLVVV